jgi:ABC-2 type transport system ATP-binding protein
MKAAVLRAENLAKRFGAVKAVSEATFEIHENTVTCLLGENGAGKTTLLKLLLGFLRPDSGRFSSTVRRIGYVPERPSFFPWLSGAQVLRLTARASGFPEHDIDRMIDRLGRDLALDHRLLSRKGHTYSPGNQKKLSYLQSLLISPELLIIDEPFSALDPPAIRGLRTLFLDLKNQGKTLLLSSHLISELEKVCDEYIIIKAGHVVAQGKFTGQPDLETLFFRYSEREESIAESTSLKMGASFYW